MNSSQYKALAKLDEWRDKVPEGVWNSTPLDLEEVGQYWGIKKVIKRPLNVSGLLYKLDEGGAVVFLNEDHPPTRQRFSWAHELGHIVMADSDLSELSCLQHGQINKDLERCCDVIAAELLMPKRYFCSAAEEVSWSLAGINNLAKCFKVSTESAAIRMLDFQDEPIVMSMWRLDKKLLSGLELMWSYPNERGKTFTPSINRKSSPDAIGPIFEALQTSEVSLGSCRVLMKAAKESKSKSYKSVPTEGIGIGRGNTRRVIGFHYLARKSQ